MEEEEIDEKKARDQGDIERSSHDLIVLSFVRSKLERHLQMLIRYRASLANVPCSFSDLKSRRYRQRVDLKRGEPFPPLAGT